MTPRELTLCADGYRWRDRRDWEKRAIELAYLLSPWPRTDGTRVMPQDILDAIFPPSDPTRFEQVAGLATADEAIDVMIQRQQQRRAPRT